MDNVTGILVLSDLVGGSLTSTTKELLAAGRPLAKTLGQKLSLALLGSDLTVSEKEAFSHGADQLYIIEHPLLAEYQVDLHLEALTQICRQSNPNIILMGRTANGRDLAPRLATRLDVALAQDCLAIEIDDKSNRMVAHRPVYGGNAMAAVVCTGTPQMATLRPKVYEPLQPDSSHHGDIISADVELVASMARVKLVKRVEEEAGGIQLENARIVVAGGRGMGGPESFKDLEELADLLGAGIGASRAVVDAGWAPPHMQIGLTGKAITPDLYITVAISGASQHMAGCSGAKVIVAINKDGEANIFKEARYGVIGDWKKALPSFTTTLRELMA